MAAYGNLDRALPGLKYDLGYGYKYTHSAAAQEDIEFGLPVFSYDGEEDQVWLYHIDSAKIDLTAAALGTNGTYVFPLTDTVTVTVTTTTGTVGSRRDEIVFALDGTVGVDAIVDPTDANTIQVRYKGEDLILTTTNITKAAAPIAGLTLTLTTDAYFVGIACFTQKNVGLQNYNEANYQQYQEVNIEQRGRIYVNIDATVTAYQSALLSVSGTGAGTIFTTSTVDSVNVGAVFFESVIVTGTTIDAEKLAVIEINGPVKVDTTNLNF
jgi:hypothetical protein